MDYHKIIKSRKVRFAILKALSFIPDSIMLKLQYLISTGHKLSLRCPKRFTEKLQLYKMYYRNRDLNICVDKYRVREYIAGKGLSEILVRLYGVFSNADEINFDTLPSRFVLKTTDGGGGIM